MTKMTMDIFIFNSFKYVLSLDDIFGMEVCLR